MLVLPNRLLYWVLSTSDQGFVSFQPILCHPRTQIEIILFHDEQRDIPNLETFSQPCFNWIFSNCLSHNSPAKGWPYRFRSRGTTGSSILDHDFGHVCRGRRTQMSGHSDFEIFNNLGASSIFSGYEQTLRPLLVPRNQAIWRWYPFGCCYLRCWRSLFSEYCLRSRIIFHNITSNYNSAFVFLVLCLQ